MVKNIKNLLGNLTVAGIIAPNKNSLGAQLHGLGSGHGRMDSKFSGLV